MTSKSTEMGVDVGELRRLVEKATPGPASVGYDGPSRPIICTRPSFEMLSISKLTAPGRHESYEREDEDCRLFAFILTHALSIAAALEELAALRKDRERLDWFENHIGWDWRMPMYRGGDWDTEPTDDARSEFAIAPTIRGMIDAAIAFDSARTAKGGDRE